MTCNFKFSKLVVIFIPSSVLSFSTTSFSFSFIFSSLTSSFSLSFISFFNFNFSFNFSLSITSTFSFFFSLFFSSSSLFNCSISHFDKISMGFLGFFLITIVTSLRAFSDHITTLLISTVFLSFISSIEQDKPKQSIVFIRLSDL